jgi:UDP-N-acetylglucosamine acyltransferase
MTAREPAKYCGLNLVGLRRRGFSRETIDQLHRAFQIIMGEGLLTDKMEQVKTEIGVTPETEYILDFLKCTEQRGFIH